MWITFQKNVLIQNAETCYCVVSQIVVPPKSMSNSYQKIGGIHQATLLMLRLSCNYINITNLSFYANLPKSITQNENLEVRLCRSINSHCLSECLNIDLLT